MKNLIRSFTEKIDSLMSAFSARSGTTLEEERKIRFFSLVTLMAIPIFIGFSILHLSQGTAAHPVILLVAGAGQVLSLLAIKRLKNPKVAFRICASVLGVYFLFSDRCRRYTRNNNAVDARHACLFLLPTREVGRSCLDNGRLPGFSFCAFRSDRTVLHISLRAHCCGSFFANVRTDCRYSLFRRIYQGKIC